MTKSSATDPQGSDPSPTNASAKPLSEPAIRALVEELLDRQEGDLIRYAMSLCGNRDLAEDAVQEAFVALVANLRDGKTVDDPAAWLTRVVRNRARDSQRKEIRVHRREAAVATLDRGRPTPDVLEQEESHGEVARLLSELEPDLREVIELCVIGGKSYREVAAITGASLGTVSTRIHQGLSRIAGGLRAAGVL